MSETEANGADEARAELMQLLESNFDNGADDPETWEEWQQRNADAILAAGFRKVEATETCPACQGTRGYWAERWHDCPACEGAGRVKTKDDK